MEKMTYETAVERLTVIVKELESGGKNLDESVRLFEEGAALAKFCSEQLENAQQKIISLDEATGNE